jgi:hypothetical protein
MTTTTVDKSHAQRVKSGVMFRCLRCGKLFTPLYEQYRRGFGYCTRQCTVHDSPATRARKREAALRSWRNPARKRRRPNGNTQPQA